MLGLQDSGRQALVATSLPEGSRHTDPFHSSAGLGPRRALEGLPWRRWGEGCAGSCRDTFQQGTLCGSLGPGPRSRDQGGDCEGGFGRPRTGVQTVHPGGLEEGEEARPEVPGCSESGDPHGRCRHMTNSAQAEIFNFPSWLFSLLSALMHH